MASAVAVFIVASIAMLQRKEPFYSWFYSFAWWSYIVFIEAFLCARGGTSLLFGSPRVFVSLLPLSVTIWLIFEALNFRLQNWHYVDITPHLGLRWPGYAIAFATVVPGIFATKHLLEYKGFFKASQTAPIRPHALTRTMLVLGLLFLVLPIVKPRVFFPLVWGAFIFLLEPINYHMGGRSLLRDWQSGSLREFYLLLLAGLCCGFLWEFWNFWAGSKWIYTVPHVGWLKIFEMPILGFLGFPPFAVECYVMVNSFLLLDQWLKQNRPPRLRRRVWLVIVSLAGVFDLLVFMGIDHFTVISFAR